MRSIPGSLEKSPERFLGNHTLQLGSKGFTFQAKASRPLKFFLLSSCGNRRDQFLISLPKGNDNGRMNYTVRPWKSPSTHSPTSDGRSWCILVDDDALHPRGARFVINRIHENNIYLHFDYPLGLSAGDTSTNTSMLTDQLLGPVFSAESAGPEHEFIIEKSSTPQTLSVSRPQNPEQYADRLIVMHGALYFGLGHAMRYLGGGRIDELCSNSRPFFLLWFLVNHFQLRWTEQALYAFAHRAWMETYAANHNPNGRWKWFWHLSNFVSPIPF